MLRKLILPVLVLAVLPLTYLALAAYFPDFVQAVLHAVPGDGPAATGAEIAAGRQAGGIVPSGTIASKLLVAVAAYLVFSLVPWLVQRVTHPTPTAWAKERYARIFSGLPASEQFTVYQRIQLVNVIKAAAALVFAALVV